MFQILLMGFVAKYYYELAQEYYKHRWGYAFLGAGIYFVSNYLFGLFSAFVLFPIFGWKLYQGSTMIIVPILFSLLVCLILYLQFNRIWKSQEQRELPDEIDQIGQQKPDL